LDYILKGTVSRDFLLPVFFMHQFPPSPRVSHYDRFEFFRKFAEIFASQSAPPVSTTPAANLPPVSTTPAANCHRCQRHRRQIATGINDTGGKFATGINDTGGNFATIFPCVVDTGGKFATGVNDTGGKFAAGVNDTGGNLPPVSTTPAVNMPPVSMTPVANNWNNIRLLRP
jgi:hypothetical protein